LACFQRFVLNLQSGHVKNGLSAITRRTAYPSRDLCRPLTFFIPRCRRSASAAGRILGSIDSVKIEHGSPALQLSSAKIKSSSRKVVVEVLVGGSDPSRPSIDEVDVRHRSMRASWELQAGQGWAITDFGCRALRRASANSWYARNCRDPNKTSQNASRVVSNEGQTVREVCQPRRLEATRDRFAGKESAAARSRVMPSGKSHPGRHSGAKSPPTLGSRARADVGAREVAGKTGKLQYLAKKRPKRASDGRVGSPAEKSIITTAASDARSTGVV
jgi:hypothetical protein